MTTTAPPTTISVELAEQFDPRWARLPGITIDGRTITIDPAAYFFRFSSASWLVCDWDTVRVQFLDTRESGEIALEQAALDFIRTHARCTSDESVKAHAALGGRLVHGCQSVPNQSGGACVPYGASIEHFRDDLAQFRPQWLTAVYACRAAS